MKFKIKKFLLVSVLIGIILFSICPKAFATNGNEMSISSKTGIGNTIEIVSGNSSNIKSESVADVVNYLSGQNITVNSITNHKGASVELTSTALIGTGYVLDTSNGNYSVIVYGDANGDGEADAGDMKVIIDNFLGINQASPIAKLAVDVYQDGDLDAADLKQVLDSFLGNLTGSIVKTTNASNPTPDVSPTPDISPTFVGVNPQIKIGNQTITLTSNNAPEYYGQVVTNYSATNSATWRLFYVDFDGKYGDAGTIYLKADQVSRMSLNTTDSVNSEDALNKMKQINPAWAQNDGVANLVSEKAALYLCDESNWSSYKNADKVTSVIGAPSVEMFLDSYNQYHSIKQTAGYEKIKYKWANNNPSRPEIVTSGYCFAVGENNENYEYTTSELKPGENNFYTITEPGKIWWLASSNIQVPNRLCTVGGTIYNANVDEGAGICPVVSLKSGVIPEISSITPTPTPTQVTGNLTTPYSIVFDVCDANDSRIKYANVDLTIGIYDEAHASSMYRDMTNLDGKFTISNITEVGKIEIYSNSGCSIPENTYVELATNSSTGKIYIAGMNNVGDVSLAGNQLVIQVLATQQ